MQIDVKHNVITLGNPEEIIQLKDLIFKREIKDQELNKQLLEQLHKAYSITNVNDRISEFGRIHQALSANEKDNSREIKAMKSRILEACLKEKIEFVNKEWDHSAGLKVFLNDLWKEVRDNASFNLDKLAYITKINCNLDGDLSFILLNDNEFNSGKKLNIFKNKDFIISLFNGNTSISFDKNLEIVLKKQLPPDMLNLGIGMVYQQAESNLKLIKEKLNEIKSQVKEINFTINDSEKIQGADIIKM